MNVIIMVLLTLGVLMRTEIWKSFITSIISMFSATAIVSVMSKGLKKDIVIFHFEEKIKVCQNATVTILDIFYINVEESIFYNIAPYFAFLVAISVFCGLKVRQQMKRIQKKKPTKTPDVVFPGISRINSDDSFRNLLKFLVNYGFYKFGFEITLIMFIIVIFIRMDIYVVPYICWFILLSFRNREKAEIFWLLAASFISISITIQICTIVIFNALISCLSKIDEYKSVTKILRGSLVTLNEDPTVLIWDFLLLFLMSSQV